MNATLETRLYVESPAIDLRDENGDTWLRGYPVVWGARSSPIGGFFTEEIQRGAFGTIPPKEDIRALVHHDNQKILGRTSSGTLVLADDERGLRADIKLPKTSDAADLVAHLNHGNIKGMSFGFICESDKWEKVGRDSEDKTRAHRTVLRARLIEVSAVPCPAYPDTSIAVKRSLDELGLEMEGRSGFDLMAYYQARLRLWQLG
jgi:uncharacterized protein